MASKTVIKSEEGSSTTSNSEQQESVIGVEGRNERSYDGRLSESSKSGSDRFREFETRKSQVISDVRALMEEFGILSVENLLAVVTPHMPLFVRKTPPSLDKPSLLRLQNKSSPCRVLGVFGLSSNTTDKDLRDLFETYGSLTGVQPEYSRGYAFICYKNVEDAIEAKSCCDDAEVNGRRISCQHFYHKGSCSRADGKPCALFNSESPLSLEKKNDKKDSSIDVAKPNQTALTATTDALSVNGCATQVIQSKGAQLRNISGQSSPAPQNEVMYTMSSTGKRHYKTCTYFGCGRPCGSTEGIPCFYCGGGPQIPPQPSFEFSP